MVSRQLVRKNDSKLLLEKSRCLEQLGCQLRCSAVPFHHSSTTGVCLVSMTCQHFHCRGQGGEVLGPLDKIQGIWLMRLSPALFLTPRFLECCPSVPGARKLASSGFWPLLNSLIVEQYAEKQCHLSCLLLVMLIRKRNQF